MAAITFLVMVLMCPPWQSAGMKQAIDRTEASTGFGGLLKQWRATRKYSQLDLAMESGVSQRHVSFLESGRSKPSREMVLALAGALDVPLREQNGLLNAAGFAPLYRQRSLDDEDMAPLRGALDLMLAHHDPYPALAVDRRWDLVAMNDACERVFGLVGDLDTLWRNACGDGPRNVLRLSFHPQGLRPFVANWDECAPLVIARLYREAAENPESGTRELLDELFEIGEIPPRWRVVDWDRPPLPIMPVTYGLPPMQLSLFSMISTFGTAQDVTADELRIETFFPADDATRELLQQLHG